MPVYAINIQLNCRLTIEDVHGWGCPWFAHKMHSRDQACRGLTNWCMFVCVGGGGFVIASNQGRKCDPLLSDRGRSPP